MRSVENAMHCVDNALLRKCAMWRMYFGGKCALWKMYSFEDALWGKCVVWKLHFVETVLWRKMRSVESDNALFE